MDRAKAEDQAGCPAPSPAPLPPDPPRASGRGRLRHLRGGLRAAALTLVVLAVMGALALVAWRVVAAGRAIPLPEWVVAEAEERINAAVHALVLPSLAPHPGGLRATASVALGAAGLRMGQGGQVHLALDDLRLVATDGRTVARIPQTDIALDGAALWRGAFRPVALRLSGATLALRRNADSSFELVPGADGAAMAQTPLDLAALVDLIGGVFALPMLERLTGIDAEAMSITLDDRRAGRVWTAGDGRLAIARPADRVLIDLGFGLVGGGALPAQARLRIARTLQPGPLSVVASFEQVAASDIAAQVPPLGWLGMVDGPISGGIEATLAPDGAILALSGALDFGAGVLRPGGGAAPVAFRGAGVRLVYDPVAQSFAFPALSVDSGALRLAASGTAFAEAGPGSAIGSGVAPGFVVQAEITDLMVNPEGLFAEPVQFREGALDLRLRFDPFTLEIGQLALRDGGRRLDARGRVAAPPEGWDIALDVSLDAIAHERMLALWPVRLKPKTRAWIAANVHKGLLLDAAAALRIAPGATEPTLHLRYEFEDADVQVLRTLPPIRAGRGHAVLDGQSYTLVLDAGQVLPPAGGAIDVAGSVLRVPDVTVRPSPAEVVLRTRGTIEAALSLLDQPPFGFVNRGGIPPDLATGRAEIETRLRMPLKQQLTLDEVAFDVAGTLRDVRSTRMVPGRVVAADSLRIEASRSGIAISGEGTVGGVGFSAAWRRALGPTAPAESRIEARLALGPAFAATFLPALPEGTISGEGALDVEITLPKGAPGRIRLASDLRGVGIDAPQIGWSLAQAAGGEFSAEATLGESLVFEDLRLAGPGLVAEGRLALAPGGGLGRLELSRLALGDWLDATALVEAAASGTPPVFRLTGGELDLRRMPAGGTGGGGGAEARAVEVALDRVRISRGIDLRGVEGRFTTGAGLRGAFTGRVNGRAVIAGEVVPGPAGSRIRVAAGAGGEVLAAAGVFPDARGGRLDLTLDPAGGRGEYAGRIDLTGVRVGNLPVLAELLNAVSIVGLLEQLQSGGLLFDTAGADFRIDPRGLTIRNASAVGASFGVSLDGVYDARSRELDLRGVLSPVYLVNVIGRPLTRAGEGLFGFTFRIRGPTGASRVEANPLSLLAPGMLRDIFRGDPPELAP